FGAHEPSRPTCARERPVEASERLESDEIAEYEHVERNLEPQLALDLGRRVGVLAGLVVLHDPASAERVDVGPVDLSGGSQPRPELKAALEPRRSPFVPEADSEAARNKRQAGFAPLLYDRLEVSPQRLVELAQLHLRELHPHAAESVVQALPHQSLGVFDV